MFLGLGGREGGGRGRGIDAGELFAGGVRLADENKLERAEKQLARRFDLCTATTRAEWQTLEDYGTGAPTDPG